MPITKLYIKGIDDIVQSKYKAAGVNVPFPHDSSSLKSSLADCDMSRILGVMTQVELICNAAAALFDSLIFDTDETLKRMAIIQLRTKNINNLVVKTQAVLNSSESKEEIFKARGVIYKSPVLEMPPQFNRSSLPENVEVIYKNADEIPNLKQFGAKWGFLYSNPGYFETEWLEAQLSVCRNAELKSQKHKKKNKDWKKKGDDEHHVQQNVVVVPKPTRPDVVQDKRLRTVMCGIFKSPILHGCEPIPADVAKTKRSFKFIAKHIAKIETLKRITRRKVPPKERWKRAIKKVRQMRLLNIKEEVIEDTWSHLKDSDPGLAMRAELLAKAGRKRMRHVKTVSKETAIPKEGEGNLGALGGIASMMEMKAKVVASANDDDDDDWD